MDQVDQYLHPRLYIGQKHHSLYACLTKNDYARLTKKRFALLVGSLFDGIIEGDNPVSYDKRSFEDFLWILSSTLNAFMTSKLKMT